MAAADPEAAYYQAVEEYFVSRRGDPLFLSNADWNLVRKWRLAGLPLRVVLRGIRDALDAHAHGWSRDRKVGSLAYCAREVDAARERWERALALGREEGRGRRRGAARASPRDLERATGLGPRRARWRDEIARELRERAAGGPARGADGLARRARGAPARGDRGGGAARPARRRSRPRWTRPSSAVARRACRRRVLEQLRRESARAPAARGARAAAPEPLPPRGAGAGVSDPAARACGRGDVVELAIEKGVYRGRGLGRLDGRVVFVPAGARRAIASGRGSRAVHAGWAEGDARRGARAAPRPARVAVPLRAAVRRLRLPGPRATPRSCGVKESILRESLARAGAPLRRARSRRTPRPSAGWRMRASLHFGVGERRAPARAARRRARGGSSTSRRASSSRERDEPGGAGAARRRSRSGPALGRALRGLDLLESPDGAALVATLETALAAARGRALGRLGRAAPGLTGFGVRAAAARLALAPRDAARRGDRPRA